MNTRKTLRVGLIITAMLALVTLLGGRAAFAQSTPAIGIGLTKAATFSNNSAIFTITVLNLTNPPRTITNATVRDAVPTVYTITSTPAQIQATCTLACTVTIENNLITVVFPTIGAGQSGQFSFSVTFAPGTALTNTAIVQGIIDGRPTVEVGAEVSPPKVPSGPPITGEGTIFDSAPVAAWGIAGVVAVLVTAFGLATIRRRRIS